MIAQSNGEVCFNDGLCIPPFASIQAVVSLTADASHVLSRHLPLEGWRQFDLGIHISDYGQFVVEATVGSEERVDAVFLSHCHSFYDKSAKGDAERRTFHEGIIATELRGQREFSWGSVICKYDAAKNRDWLVIIFNPFTNVPRKERHEAMVLTAHEEIPKKIARP